MCLPAGHKKRAAAAEREVLVTRNTLTGRVLSFNLDASHPHDYPAHLAGDMLGVDICP
jgi:hypothetical protein